MHYTRTGVKQYNRYLHVYELIFRPSHTYIYNIERVQRSFTKRLPGFKSLSYTERLLRLNLESLESRRVKADLVLLFKIFMDLLILSTVLRLISSLTGPLGVMIYIFANVILTLMLGNSIFVIV